MKNGMTPDESLFPVMQFLPVLSTHESVVISQGLLKALKVRPSLELESAGNDFNHFICDDEELCHKKKAIHLFLLSLAIFSRNSASSLLWLRQDTELTAPSEVMARSISLTAPIQLFLYQSGFQIKPQNSVLRLSDQALLQSLLVPPKLQEVG